MTWTQTTLNIKDAAGNSQPVIAYTDGTNFSFAHPLLDNTGAIVAPANAGNQATGNTSLATIATNTTGGATAANQATGNTALAAIQTAVQAATPAGTNIIGKVGIDQTTPGTTNLVQLPSSQITTLTPPTTVTVQQPTGSNLHVVNDAGTAIIGKVTTDQTSHGTTDLVAADITKVGGTALALGQTAMAASLPVAIASNQTTLPVTTQPLVTASGTLTRPANTTAYAVGNLIANSTTAGSVTAITITNCARGTGVNGRITGAFLAKSGTTTTNAIFRAHFFNVNPCASAPTNGDGGAFALASKSGYLGYMDFSLTYLAFGDGCQARGNFGIGSFMNFSPVSGTGNLYVMFEARGAYTPASAETFTLTVEVE